MVANKSEAEIESLVKQYVQQGETMKRSTEFLEREIVEAGVYEPLFVKKYM
jgi:hypothetical protein